MGVRPFRRKKKFSINSCSSSSKFGLIRKTTFSENNIPTENPIITTLFGCKPCFFRSNRSLESYITGTENKQRNISSTLSKVLIVIGVLLLLLGVTLIIFASTKFVNENKKKSSSEDLCSLSKEAKNIGLRDLLLKVREEYYNVFPEEMPWNPEANLQMIHKKYKIYNPLPENIQRITNSSIMLLKEAKALKPDLSKLKPREHKAYLQAIHFLENTFGHGYLNYKAGLWLMGPTSFCAEPMCFISYAINNGIGFMSPRSEKDVMRIENHLKDVNQSVYDYIDVLKMGIQKGMVRTQIECEVGFYAMESRFQYISEEGAKGVHKEWYTKKFFMENYYINISQELHDLFVVKHGKNVTEYVQNLLVPTIGEPISNMLKYLEFDHLLYCRPNDVGAGGLSALPLDYIYYNGTLTTNKTDPFLPNCTDGKNCRLNGSEAYHAILGYFTTTDIHPEDVYKMGVDNLNRLYPQMIEIAKNITKEGNDTLAIKLFQQNLRNRSLNYFNEEPLPENETRGPAFKLCKTEDSAKIHCPKRWAAMMKWLSFAQKTLSVIEPKTVNFFHFTGSQKSTPSCPIEPRPNFNPSMSSQSYVSSSSCNRPCYYNIPFFLEDLGPVSSEYSVNAHEARPGHHIQVQGLTEHFRDKCGGPEGWLDDKTYYTAFTEGWALYAENPLIAQGTNIYEDNPMQKFGMLKAQIWRALRLIVDTGLHYKGMSRAEALKYFEDYAWDKTDLSKKEVTRYQSNYGQATAYMIGQLDIWKLRNITEEKLGSNYNIKDFHLQALSQGSSPLAYLRSYMGKYIECKKEPEQQYCDIVLNPTKSKSTKDAKPYVQNEKVKWPERTHYW